jgi:hypothetical protein
MACPMSRSIKRQSLSIALTLVAFFLLLNLAEPASARSTQQHSDHSTNLHVQTHPSPKLKTATPSSHQVKVNGLIAKQTPKMDFFKSGSLANHIAQKQIVFSSPFMWVKAAMKAFLASVWAGIHSHIGGLPKVAAIAVRNLL